MEREISDLDRIKHLEKIFSSMGNFSRLKILKILSGGPLCVNAIVGFLDISQPAVSQHLKILSDSGLIKGEKRGNMVHYSINTEFTEELTLFLKNLKKEEDNMCKEKEECHKGKKPGECSEEQIKECHGDSDKHECEEKGECLEE